MQKTAGKDTEVIRTTCFAATVTAVPQDPKAHPTSAVKLASGHLLFCSSQQHPVRGLRIQLPAKPFTGTHRARSSPCHARGRAHVSSWHLQQAWQARTAASLLLRPLSIQLPIPPRPLTRELRQDLPPRWACRRLPAGQANAARSASFRHTFLLFPLPTPEPSPHSAAGRYPSSPSARRRASARPPGAIAFPRPAAGPFLRPSGHAAVSRSSSSSSPITFPGPSS